MRKLISIMLAVILAFTLSMPAAAITMGKWDFSGITETIQRIGNETEIETPEESEKPPIPDSVLEQIYAAIKGRRKIATEFWNNR